jgi:hypothetical protein
MRSALRNKITQKQDQVRGKISKALAKKEGRMPAEVESRTGLKPVRRGTAPSA